MSGILSVSCWDHFWIIVLSCWDNFVIMLGTLFDAFETNLESSELIKYTNNAFFSMLISFSNEIANISEKIPGVDPYNILKALISDKRITSKINKEKIIPSLESYLIPGCGFGGSCFKKDILNLVYLCRYYGLQEVAEYWHNVVKINTPLDAVCC